MTEYEELKAESNIWKPAKPGDAVEGDIIAMVQGPYGLQVTLHLEDGKELILPSHKMLQAKLKQAKIGDRVKVTFEKEDPPKVRGEKGARIYRVQRVIIPEEEIK